MIPPRLHACLTAAQPWTADATALLARLTIGQAFLLTGIGKLRNLDGAAGFFETLGLPMPYASAVAVGGIEAIGGALLILGLATRTSAAVLAATMLGAIVTADRSGFLGALRIAPDTGLTDCVPWMFLLVLLPLLAHGPGRIAIDRLLCRRCAATCPASAAAPPRR